MGNYLRAIKRPFSDFKKLSIGALMYLIPFVNIITSFFASGYILNCVKTAMKKEHKLPEWEKFGNLFVKGLLVFVLSLIYFIPTVVVGLTLFWKFISPTGINVLMLMSAIGVIGIGILILFLLLLLTIYLVPLAIVIFASKDKFSDSFRLGIIFKKAFTGKYFIAWLVVVVYSIFISFIGGIISVLTMPTMIIPLIVNAYAQIIYGITGLTILAEAYSEIK